MTVVDAQKEARLARTLYRSLIKWCRSKPPDLSLGHLDKTVNGIDIENPVVLQQALRVAFRQNETDGTVIKTKLREAMEAFRWLNEWDAGKIGSMSSASMKPTNGIITLDKSSVHSQIQEMVDAVHWMPSIQDGADSNYQDPSLQIFPIFPLWGPLLPPHVFTYDHHLPLPLFTPVFDIPVPGFEPTLRIFEPRYRELYNDALRAQRTGTNRRFVVPFPHPTLTGVYAKHGVVYEIMRVEDVADQTNGQIHLLAHHLVTDIVMIDHVMNPSAYNTRHTYVRIQGRLVEGNHMPAGHSNVLSVMEQMIIPTLRSWKDGSTISERLLVASAEGGIWPLVRVWLQYLQTELLHLQVKISTDIQRELDTPHDTNTTTTASPFSSGISASASTMKTNASEKERQHQVIQQMQDPHRQRLLWLHVEIATLVPRLLELSSLEQQCHCLSKVFQREQRYLDQRAPPSVL